MILFQSFKLFISFPALEGRCFILILEGFYHWHLMMYWHWNFYWRRRLV